MQEQFLKRQISTPSLSILETKNHKIVRTQCSQQKALPSSYTDQSEFSNGIVGVEITQYYFPSNVGFIDISHTVMGQSGTDTQYTVPIAQARTVHQTKTCAKLSTQHENTSPCVCKSECQWPQGTGGKALYNEDGYPWIGNGSPHCVGLIPTSLHGLLVCVVSSKLMFLDKWTSAVHETTVLDAVSVKWSTDHELRFLKVEPWVRSPSDPVKFEQNISEKDSEEIQRNNGMPVQAIVKVQYKKMKRPYNIFYICTLIYGSVFSACIVPQVVVDKQLPAADSTPCHNTHADYHLRPVC